MYLPTTFKRVRYLPTTCKGESAVYPPPASPARESQLCTHHQGGVSYVPTTCKRESTFYPPQESAICPPPIYPPPPVSPARESQLSCPPPARESQLFTHHQLFTHYLRALTHHLRVSYLSTTCKRQLFTHHLQVFTLHLRES
jgi:hypothetical protein